MTVLTESYEMFARAERVIPGGIFGTRSPRFSSFGDFPAFIRSARGSRITDVDGNEYIDFMCGFGPIVLGYNHLAVQEAVRGQEERGGSFTFPGDVTLELAETLVARWDWGDWVMFGKNGSDVTTLSTRIARAHTGRMKLLVAAGAYHGFDPWSVPGGQGVPPAHRSERDEFTWNDAGSVHACFDRNEGDVAAVMLCPIRHDAMHDIELPAAEFLAAVQQRAEAAGALLIVDDIRCGFRLHPSGASHLRFGLRPDLVCFGKAIGNGQPLSLLVGKEALRATAQSLYYTGTHFFAATPMAAALAVLRAYDGEGAYEAMQSAGAMLRDGILAAARRAGACVRFTGPATMPNLLFDDDPKLKRGRAFAAAAAQRGVIFHPRHNWFLSSAHTPEDIAQAVAVAEECFRLVVAGT
ncbi:MAG: aminotransferase class III-fold pyridoxal phosphate-dependent enzyme [Dehalococcoidia bacterium]|nr:aminotransferase class III-fold pyridoxal phosphate-dependent enzyme [Dehalococcoidia bacterium]